MPVRVPPDWMVPADERILEYLEIEGPASATQITEDERIQFGRTHAQNRLPELKRREYVRLIGNGIYEITDRGRAYLEGNHNDEENQEGADGG